MSKPRPRWPIVVIAIALLLTALAAWSVTRLRPESSLEGMLDPADPATAAMGRVMANFPLAEELLVLVSLTGEDDPAKLTDFAGRLQAALAAEASTLVRATRWKAGDSARAFVQDVMAPAGLLYLDDAQLAAAEQRLTPDGMRQQLGRSAAMLSVPGPAAGGLAKALAQDPLRLHEFFVDALKSAGLPATAVGGGDAFFTADGRGLLVRIEGARPPGDLAFSVELTDAVRRVADRLNTGGLRVDLSGAYAIAAHNSTVIKRDSIESTVVSVVALALLFGLLYRRPVRVFSLAFVPVAMGLVWGFGLYACFKSTVTPLAAVIGGVLGGVGIDYPVHLMAHRRENETPLGTTRRMFAPLLAAWLTSAVGFAAVLWSPLRVLRDFALIGSLGLIGAWVATMTLLPALLTLLGDRTTGVAATRGRPAARLWPLVAWRPAVLVRGGLIVVLLTIAAAIFASRGLKEDPDLTGLHPRPNPPLETLSDIDRRMGGGGGSFVLHLRSTEDDALLRLAWRARRALAGSEAVKGLFGPASLLPDPDVAARRIAMPRDTAAVVADFRTAVADSAFDDDAFDAYAAFLPKLLRPQASPGINDLRRYPDLAQTMLPRTAGLSEATIALFPAREPTTPADVSATVAAVRERLSGIDGITLTGMAVLAHDTRAAVRRDAPRVALTALGAIVLLLVVHFRSFTLALLTVLPTLFSFACVLLAMRLFDFGLNAVNLVMFPLLLGITVDYGIFATDVLRPGVRDTATERFLAATTALLACVATTLIGFGSLVTTAVPAVRSLGWLINVGLAACLIAALFVLWPVTLRLALKRGKL
ncbi:MAG TPA: MMPL family transporter [Tepidisphaeraceae bacterium]